MSQPAEEKYFAADSASDSREPRLSSIDARAEMAILEGKDEQP